MAVAIWEGDLGGISRFEIHGVPTIVGVRWKKWKRSLELFACGKGVTNAAQNKLVFFIVGDLKCKMCILLPSQPDVRENVYTVSIEQLDRYFATQVNVPYERHIFRTITQLPTESFDPFITRLREKADCCEFGETADEEISLLGDWKLLVQSITKKTVGKMKGPDS